MVDTGRAGGDDLSLAPRCAFFLDDRQNDRVQGDSHRIAGLTLLDGPDAVSNLGLAHADHVSAALPGIERDQGDLHDMPLASANQDFEPVVRPWLMGLLAVHALDPAAGVVVCKASRSAPAEHCAHVVKPPVGSRWAIRKTIVDRLHMDGPDLVSVEGAPAISHQVQGVVPKEPARFGEPGISRAVFVVSDKAGDCLRALELSWDCAEGFVVRRVVSCAVFGIERMRK
ncbi:hypothetical protein IQ782_05490 [Salipiger pacificus]|uniref:DUF3800 domain-containing protein n=1 Tax=Salipiger mangrovisoli TaxID=2865933 RepID=A0ABR9WYC5_9RHOB|nr:hypothetical protein [Salipiger mangrovisoli]